MTKQVNLSKEEQKEHDDVIEFLRADLIREGFRVKINKGKDKQNGINDTTENGEKIKIYPDVYTYIEKKVKRIYEVETKRSVVKSEVSQWKQYSKGVEFYLVVPKAELDKAKKLAKENGVQVKGYLVF